MVTCENTPVISSESTQSVISHEHLGYFGESDLLKSASAMWKVLLATHDKVSLCFARGDQQPVSFWSGWVFWAEAMACTRRRQVMVVLECFLVSCNNDEEKKIEAGEL